MRRTGLLAVLLLAALAAPAGAWVETASYAVPGGGVADCLRAAGPGRVALLGTFGRTGTAFDLLDVGTGSLTLAGGAAFGPLLSCPQIAVAGGDPPLLVASVLDARRTRVAGLQVVAPGAPATTVVTRFLVSAVSLATAPGGAAVLAWTEVPPGGFATGRARLLAAIRLPGATRFGAPALLDAAASTDGRPATGIDTAGRATVAWAYDAPLQHGRPGSVRVADSGADGRFGPQRTLTPSWIGHVALAVTPQGRTLLVTDGLRSLQAYERLPGATQLARVQLPRTGSTEQLAIAMNPDGDAAIGYRNDGRSVFAIVRTARGAFRDGGTVVPTEHPGLRGSLTLSVSTDRSSHRPPYDDDAGDLSAALSPSGAALLTWVDGARGADAARAQVARGTLAGGFSRPQRLGSPCRSAEAARPLQLADGTLGVTWSDDARVRILSDDTVPQGGGSVHVALDRPAAPQPQPPAPQLTARLASRRALGAGQPLPVRVACRARCDVRASATARTLPKPRWLQGGGRGGEPVRIGASTTLPAGGSTILRLKPLYGSNAAGAAGAPRTPIAVLACTPDGPVAQRVELAPPRAQAPQPIPRLLGVAARRTGSGGAVRVTWRTSIPARYAHFLIYGIARGPQLVAQARRTGRGRTRFAVTLRPPSGRRIRFAAVFLQTPDVLFGPFRQVRVR